MASPKNGDMRVTLDGTLVSYLNGLWVGPELVCETSYSWKPRYANALTKGDRVRIREGYEHAGEAGEYIGKSVEEPDVVVVRLCDVLGFWDVDDDGGANLLAASIEAYPYTREERIERAIEDFDAILNARIYDGAEAEDRAALYAILDAGV